MNKSGNKKLIYPLMALLICILMGLGGFFYVNDLLNTPITLKKINVDSKAALKLSALEQISKKNGITEWKLKASSATLLKKKDKAILKDVDVIFYTKDKTQVRLTADEGTLNTLTKDMTFLKNVIVHYETYTLRTEKLLYEKKTHIIHSDVRVKFEDRGSVIEADSMVTQLNQNRTTLEGHVKGKFSENFNIP
ncbi:MAG: LPS export ABC transporter periplasmic protein LptC [Desulfobacteraceae bacterium]|nr:LPS export ABC transporter periplasmic protein LptC [Desulfobacteraceae bacterium]